MASGARGLPTVSRRAAGSGHWLRPAALRDPGLFLADLGTRLGFGFTAEAAEAQLRERSSLLIVDGLDEIFASARRRDVVEEIVGLETSAIRTPASSSPRGSPASTRPVRARWLRVATLDDLSPEQVGSFAGVWFDLVFPGDPARPSGHARICATRMRPPTPIQGTRRQSSFTHGHGASGAPQAARPVAHRPLPAGSRSALYGWDYRRDLKLPGDSPLARSGAGRHIKVLLDRVACSRKGIRGFVPTPSGKRI